MRIASRQHPAVIRLRGLATRPAPDVALLDGEHLVAEALDAGVRLQVVLADATCAPLLERARLAGATTYEGTASVLAAARPVRGATGGAVAIAAWQPLDLATAFAAPSSVMLGLVDVQDPGNLGGAIRSADALGAGAALALGESANPSGWKALRGAMGSTFRIPVGRGPEAEARALARRHGLVVAATVAHGGESLDDADLTGPMLLLVGNEGAGLSPDIVDGADLRVTIPMRRGVNSLNVSVTAALVLWARRQQRRMATQASS